MTIQGKVVYQALGPGFWGIIDDKGGEWRPINMPEQLKYEGVSVKVSAQKVEESFSVFMWGTPVRVLSFHTLMPS